MLNLIYRRYTASNLTSWNPRLNLLIFLGLIGQSCGGGLLSGSGPSDQLSSTESGIKYQYYEQHTDARQAQTGDRITFQLLVQNYQDSVLSNLTFKEHPYESSFFIGKNHFKEIFSMIHKGDSLCFWINADSLNSGYLKTPKIPQGSEIKYTLKVLEIQSKEEIKQKLKENLKVQREIDAQLIEKYLSEIQEIDTSLETQKTNSGLCYFLSQEGNGKTPQVGDTVSVNYVSKLLDGTIYGSSDGAHEFLVGHLLPGVNEAITLMREGAKGTFIIPSELGYGSKGIDNMVPPNAVLVYDIELVKVK